MNMKAYEIFQLERFGNVLPEYNHFFPVVDGEQDNSRILNERVETVHEIEINNLNNDYE